MKIYNVSRQINTTFKQNNNQNVIGYDDEASQAKRDYIREYHDKQYMPYQSIYEKEHRKSEYELKQLLSSLVRKPIIVDRQLLNNLELYNLDSVSKGIYRGGMLNYDELYKVKNLYEAGIRTIIPIGTGFSNLQDECEKIGMNYISIKFDSNNNTAFENINKVKSCARNFAEYVYDADEESVEKYINSEVNRWEKSSRKYIDTFVKYIQAMQKGNVYMGCEYGTYTTDTAVMFDYLFNPNMKHGNRLNYTNRKFLKCAENLYNNLTDTDKAKMGWSENFDNIFLQRLNNLKNHY